VDDSGEDSADSAPPSWLLPLAAPFFRGDASRLEPPGVVSPAAADPAESATMLGPRLACGVVAAVDGVAPPPDASPSDSSYDDDDAAECRFEDANTAGGAWRKP
jgi:hypothetical protein